MYTGLYKGRYRVTHPEKYKGDLQEVIYRSSWELKLMKWCDTNSSVLEWGSETVIIPYKSPVDNKVHRYFVDFYIKVIDKNGVVSKYLVEVKPKKFTAPPVVPKRKTKKFIDEVFQYGVNQAKWNAATQFCESRGMKFLILTEIDLNIRN